MLGDLCCTLCIICLYNNIVDMFNVKSSYTGRSYNEKYIEYSMSYFFLRLQQMDVFLLLNNRGPLREMSINRKARNQIIQMLIVVLMMKALW